MHRVVGQVLAPAVVKTAERLLGKELSGTVVVERAEPGSVPHGELIELGVQRLDSRKQKKK